MTYEFPLSFCPARHRSHDLEAHGATATILTLAAPVVSRRHDDDPGDAEAIGQHPEARGEERLGKRHPHLSALT